MSIFFTADTHFYHKNILNIDLEHRPFNSIEEMNEVLIKNWNNKVTNKDETYILGDFSFGNKEQTINILNRLNGQKYLIKGNHDKVVKYQEVSNKFAWVKDYYEIKKKQVGYRIILFHYPIQSWNGKHYGSLHFYGHVHSGSHRDMMIENNSYNVGVDVNNYEPISLEEVVSKF